jgi:hypothetical protein
VLFADYGGVWIREGDRGVGGWGIDGTEDGGRRTDVTGLCEERQ